MLFNDKISKCLGWFLIIIGITVILFLLTGILPFLKPLTDRMNTLLGLIEVVLLGAVLYYQITYKE
jgi:hypothetical protein